MTRLSIVSGHKEKMEKSLTLMAKRLHLVCKSDTARVKRSCSWVEKSRVVGRNKQIAAIEILTPDIGPSL